MRRCRLLALWGGKWQGGQGQADAMRAGTVGGGGEGESRVGAEACGYGGTGSRGQVIWRIDGKGKVLGSKVQPLDFLPASPTACPSATGFLSGAMGAMSLRQSYNN